MVTVKQPRMRGLLKQLEEYKFNNHLLGPNLVLCELRKSTKTVSKTSCFSLCSTHNCYSHCAHTIATPSFFFFFFFFYFFIFHFATLIKTLQIFLDFHTNGPFGFRGREGKQSRVEQIQYKISLFLVNSTLLPFTPPPSPLYPNWS